MTYIHLTEHYMLIHSCKIISICIIAFYIPKLCSFSFIYLFVREYYFGL